MKFYRALFTFFIAALLLIANVFLQRQNRMLATQVDIFRQQESPQVGTKFGGVMGTDLLGSPIVKSYGQNTDSSLFLVFSPVCRFCAQNWSYWSKLMEQVPSARIVFADATGVATEKFMRAMGVPASGEVIKLSPFAKQEYNLFVAPTTIVIGPGGEVKYSYVGILNSVELEHIKAFLTKTP